MTLNLFEHKLMFFFQGVFSTFVLLWAINKVVPIRMDPNEELLGADLMEHKINHNSVN